MGPCNLNGQHRRFGLDLLLPSWWPVLTDPECSYQNIHNDICTSRLYGVLTQTTLRILTTVSTSNPVPKIIKNWNSDGNVTMGKLNYRTAVCIVNEYSIHTLLKPTVNTVIYCIWTHILGLNSYILCLNTFIYSVWTLLYSVSQKLRKQTIFNTNTHFTIRTTYVEFQTSTTIVWQGNLISDREIKQHIWQWKDKQGCSSSSVPSVTLFKQFSSLWHTVQAVQFPLSHCSSS